MIRQTAVRALFMACLFGIGLSQLAYYRLVSFEEHVNVGAPSLSGYVEIPKRAYLADKTPDQFHSLNIPVSLVPNAYYRFRFDVLNLPRERINLTADLYAPGYDNPAQETNIHTGMSSLKSQQDFIFNLDNSPDSAYFRLFYSGLPGLEISNIQITRVPAWCMWLKWSLLVGVIGSLCLFVLTVIKHLKNIYTSESKILIPATGILLTEVPLLFVIYFVAVLVRFAMYLALPYWSGDEYIYKSIAASIWQFGHHGVLADSMVSSSVDLPNLLYPYLISPAFALGENFYTGIRLINALVINAAIFPCYLIARKYLERIPSLIAVVFSIAIPFINLGAFAVTETLFFPLFLLAVWVAIESIEHRHSIAWAAAFGLITAVLLNVRLTAMVLLPAYLLSLLWISVRQRQAWNLLVRPIWLGTLITFACSYLAIKYSLDGKAIGDIGLYAGIAGRSDGPVSIVLKDPSGAFNLLAGHLTTLSIPYALPIAIMLTSAMRRRNQLSNDDRVNDFHVVALVFSAAIFTLALLFTIGVSAFDLGGLGRWHSRYYFYCYPLFIIVGAVIVDRHKNSLQSNRLMTFTIVAILLACNVYFIKSYGALQNPWFGSIADNMDVQWYRIYKGLYWLFVAATAVIAWLWYKRSTLFVSSLISFMIAWVLVANVGTLRTAGISNDVQSDACGSLSWHFLEQHPGRFVVIGEDRPTLVGAAFWNPYIPEKAFIFPEHTKLLGPDEVAVTTDYLIVNGKIPVDSVYHQIASIGDCAIYEPQSESKK